MVAFGKIQKQQNGYFGRPTKGSYIFNRVKSMGSSVPILPPVEPQQHPLLPNADVFLKASYGDIDAMKKMNTLDFFPTA